MIKMFYPEKIKNKKRFNLFCFCISLSIAFAVSVITIRNSLSSIPVVIAYILHIFLCFFLLEMLRHNQEILEVGKKFEDAFEKDISNNYEGVIMNNHEQASILIESKLSFKKRLWNWTTNPIMYIFKRKIRW
jgi:c-di-AMP phosphodiesterase-like protein